MSYTFHTLSDADFEELIADLLSAELGVRLQPFTKGRDGGIDLLAGNTAKQGLIVQCKHYARSTFSTLLSQLKRREKPRIDDLAPNQYYLATSQGLTPPNKQEIKDVLAPHISSVEHIYGNDDLNQLLRSHPDVEKRHFKLWITSTAVLQRILHNAAAVWESLEREDIERALTIYVRTDAEDKALTCLKERGSCILSGIPGVGKTTLARALVARFIADGFDIVYARDDIDQALDMLDSSKRQVIYYDDFLGRTDFAEKLGKNEEHRIIRLLRQAKKSPNLMVVLTTREYILQDAKRHYERLADGEVDLAKCIVDIEGYTRPLRARLLYNHLYFSDLSHDHLNALVSHRVYQELITHPNFVPRAIEWMTKSDGGAKVAPDEYAAAFTDALDHPERIWENAFQEHIGKKARSLLFVLATYPNAVRLDLLQAAWETIQSTEHLSGMPRERCTLFFNLLKQLDGSFIAMMKSETSTSVQFHNPSIRDYIRHEIASDDELQRFLLEHAMHFEQVQTLLFMTDEGQIGRRPDKSLLVQPGMFELLKRTITEPAASLVEIRYKAGGRDLMSLPTDIGQRLSVIQEWVAILDLPGSRAWVDNLAESALTTAPPTAEMSTAILPVLELWIADGIEHHASFGSVISSVDRTVEVFGSSNNWLEWSRFLAEHDEVDLPVDRVRWQKLAASRLDEEIQAGLYDADSYTEMEHILDWINDFSDIWGIDIKEDLDELEKRRDELGAREDAQADSWRDDYLSSEEASALDVDALFDSLLQRPE